MSNVQGTYTGNNCVAFNNLCFTNYNSCSQITFMERHMRKLDFEPQSFDAISFRGSFVYVNPEDYLPMFRKDYVSINCE